MKAPRPTNPDGSRQIKLLDKRLKVRRMRGGAAVGDQMFGAPGGSRRTAPFVLSYDLADELAKELGTDTETAHRCIMALGRASQRMLLRGQPVGIPHVATLHLRQYVSRCITGLQVANGRRTDEPIIRHVRYIAVTVPDSLRPFFCDNAVYTGSIKDHLSKARRTAAKRLRRRGDGSLKHQKVTP